MSEQKQLIQFELSQNEIYMTACSIAGSIKQYSVMGMPPEEYHHMHTIFQACMNRATSHTKDRIKTTSEMLKIFIEDSSTGVTAAIMKTAEKIDTAFQGMEKLSDDVNDLINPGA